MTHREAQPAHGKLIESGIHATKQSSEVVFSGLAVYTKHTVDFALPKIVQALDRGGWHFLANIGRMIHNLHMDMYQQPQTS